MIDYFESELTRQYLIGFLKETEEVMGELLQELDSNSQCKLYPSLDLGFPHDLIRIVGGFPTGSLITWKSSMPFVPIDTTVNVCTSSVFWLEEDISNKIDSDYFEAVLAKLENSSYKLNFHRGNHFIIYARSEKSGQHCFILHSSASEFKRTYNGLFPVESNWFMNYVRVFQRKNRRIRYLTGKKAERFFEIAKQIEEFNTVRHNFFAEVLTDSLCGIVSESHEHHYKMPDAQSVLIGSFLVSQGETVPIFTYPGDPIFLFEVETSSTKIDTEEGEKHLIPHGWGKTCTVAPEVIIDLDKKLYRLNDELFEIESSSSLRAHPDLELRRFSTDETANDYYFKLIDKYIGGSVTDKLHQLMSYNKNGFIDWHHV